jgi:hypothetical protein
VYLADSPDNYLMHVGFEVDENIWLTQEDVAKGEDTVVKAALAWINSMVHAYNVRPNLSYVKPAIDTLTITANVKNPPNHNLHIAAIINTLDSIRVDSILMVDDGNHGDSLAGDGLFGCYLNPLSSEDVFTISASVTDLDSNHYHILPNAKRITTIGPIKVENYNLEHILFTIYSLNLSLRNLGQTSTAKNITIELTTTDTTSVSTIIPINKVAIDIPAGQIIEIEQSHNITFTSTPADIIHCNVKVYSNGYQFWKADFEISASLEKKDQIIPKTFSLSQNAPNPFNPSTMISYQLPKTSDVEISIFNLMGQKVATLIDKKQNAGTYQVDWDARGFASGVYYYRLEAGDYTDVMKMVLLK